MLHSARLCTKVCMWPFIKQYYQYKSTFVMFSLSRKTVHLLFCLLLLYGSWGSVPLGNKIALEYFPGFMLAGLRFSVAGFALLAYTFVRREASRITRTDIKHNIINGFFLVMLSSGFVAKAQESVPSGMAAVLFGAAPIWLVLGEWLLWGGKRPTFAQATGLILGFCALVWLNFYQGMSSEASVFGLLLLLFSTFAWVYGTHLSQVLHNKSTLSVLRTTGLVLLFGGLETLLLALLTGERVDVFALPAGAYFSLAYLAFFSSIIGYTSYLWILFNSRAIVAISYEYVTPGIAIILGALFAEEPLDVSVLLVSILLLCSVFFMTSNDKS